MTNEFRDVVETSIVSGTIYDTIRITLSGNLDVLRDPRERQGGPNNLKRPDPLPNESYLEPVIYESRSYGLDGKGAELTHSVSPYIDKYSAEGNLYHHAYPTSKSHRGDGLCRFTKPFERLRP